MNHISPKVCVLGTHHAYQYKRVRKKYLHAVKDLIQIHSVDLVAEEATGIEGGSFAKEIADLTNTPWKNVDLTHEEREVTPDINRMGIGTQIDLDLHSLREWVWVIRTAKAMKESALLICGFAHTTGISCKFRSIGFDVETHVYLDNADDKLIANRFEDESGGSMEKQRMTQAEQAVLMWPILTLAARTQQILSYSAVEGFTGIARQGQNQALDLIHGYCQQHGFPLLNVLVISQETGLPGQGFPEKMEPVQILTEQARVFVFDWSGKDKPRPQDFETSK